MACAIETAEFPPIIYSDLIPRLLLWLSIVAQERKISRARRRLLGYVMASHERHIGYQLTCIRQEDSLFFNLRAPLLSLALPLNSKQVLVAADYYSHALDRQRSRI
jgi:hypothetical protein